MTVLRLAVLVTVFALLRSCFGQYNSVTGSSSVSCYATENACEASSSNNCGSGIGSCGNPCVNNGAAGRGGGYCTNVGQYVWACPQSYPTSNGSCPGTGLSIVAIAGGIVGGLLGLVVIVIFVLTLCWFRRARIGALPPAGSGHHSQRGGAFFVMYSDSESTASAPEPAMGYPRAPLPLFSAVVVGTAATRPAAGVPAGDALGAPFGFGAPRPGGGVATIFVKPAQEAASSVGG